MLNLRGDGQRTSAAYSFLRCLCSCLMQLSPLRFFAVLVGQRSSSACSFCSPFLLKSSLHSILLRSLCFSALDIAAPSASSAASDSKAASLAGSHDEEVYRIGLVQLWLIAEKLRGFPSLSKRKTGVQSCTACRSSRRSCSGGSDPFTWLTQPCTTCRSSRRPCSGGSDPFLLQQCWGTFCVLSQPTRAAQI